MGHANFAQKNIFSVPISKNFKGGEFLNLVFSQNKKHNS